MDTIAECVCVYVTGHSSWHDNGGGGGRERCLKSSVLQDDAATGEVAQKAHNHQSEGERLWVVAISVKVRLSIREWLPSASKWGWAFVSGCHQCQSEGELLWVICISINVRVSVCEWLPSASKWGWAFVTVNHQQTVSPSSKAGRVIAINKLVHYLPHQGKCL